MARELAIVYCVHHKPWLSMATLITTLVQDYQGADLHFVYNVDPPAGSAAARAYDNGQLSPFDPRVREVCRLNRAHVFEHEYANDEALDSGAWYKFIRDGAWKDYDAVLFVGEGTLLARPRLLSAMRELARTKDAHVVASGHEKRRLPKDTFLAYRGRHAGATDSELLEDRMIQRTFDVFCRDPQFRLLFDAWRSDFQPVTENHVPASGPVGPLRRRLHARLPDLALPFRFDYGRSRLEIAMGSSAVSPDPLTQDIYIDGRRMRSPYVTEVISGVGFHQVASPEWYGCATNHFMTRTFLERFSEKLCRFGIFDVLDVPFAGTALEVIWGFIPVWLGFTKWFTDGFHRVRKDFVTYRREDYAPDISGYLNRYYGGALAIDWARDYLKVRAYRAGLERLAEELPPVYFA